jgi:hypothetical protein
MKTVNPPSSAKASEVIIEFRNGSFFGGLQLENGVPRDKAQRFASKSAADKFMQKHEWILFNGGMVLPANQ